MVPHTVIVDFAVALLVTSLLCDFLAAVADEAELRTVALWTLIFGCGAAALSALSGFDAASHAEPVGEALRTVTWHRNAGLTTLAGALPLTVWRYRSGATPPDHPVYWLLAAGTAAALLTTAYLGGSAVFRHAVGVTLPR